MGWSAFIGPLPEAGRDESPVARSDFEHRGADGRQRKAILVRRVHVKRPAGGG